MRFPGEEGRNPAQDGRTVHESTAFLRAGVQPQQVPGRLWSGNFSTGDISQWTGNPQAAALDRFAVITPRVPHYYDDRVLRVTVPPRDRNAPRGYRAELVELGSQAQRTQEFECYYRWSTWFTNDINAESGQQRWQVFTQWHQPANTGGPPIQFSLYGGNIQLQLYPPGTTGHPTVPDTVWTVPFQRLTWHDFVLHVRFSNSEQLGFVELWYGNNPQVYNQPMPPQRVLARRPARTIAGSYLKQGLYRGRNIQTTGRLIHAGMVQGTTLASVWEPDFWGPPPAQ